MALALIALVGIAILVAIVVAQTKKLDDPANQTVVYLDELPALVALGRDGLFVLNVYRQSGNPHSDGRIFQSPDEAVAAAMSTCRRAQIDAVSIQTNDAERLEVSRAFFSHRGRKEGKKVGRFEIIRVAED